MLWLILIFFFHQAFPCSDFIIGDFYLLIMHWLQVRRAQSVYNLNLMGLLWVKALSYLNWILYSAISKETFIGLVDPRDSLVSQHSTRAIRNCKKKKLIMTKDESQICPLVSKCNHIHTCPHVCPLQTHTYIHICKTKENNTKNFAGHAWANDRIQYVGQNQARTRMHEPRDEVNVAAERRNSELRPGSQVCWINCGTKPNQWWSSHEQREKFLTHQGTQERVGGKNCLGTLHGLFKKNLISLGL